MKKFFIVAGIFICSFNITYAQFDDSTSIDDAISQESPTQAQQDAANLPGINQPLQTSDTSVTQTAPTGGSSGFVALAPIPGLTQGVTADTTGLANFFNNLYKYVIGMAAVAVAFRQYMKTESGRRRVGGIGLATPLVGDLMVQSAMYRFSSSIALLLKAGIPMLETMTALGGVFHTSPIYREALGRASGQVAAGRPLATALEDTGLFTTMMTNMVRIGEESGQLAPVMEQIAPYYKEKMESFLAKLTKMMEPVIIMGMGSTVAGLMLAIYLPMFEMAGKVH